MTATTPALLALEIGVSQKRVRDVLRSLYGTLQEPVTRWILTDDQASAVRARLSGDASSSPWSLEPGDQLLRKDLHAVYKGNAQSGIVTSSVIPDILIFSSKTSGSRYGYDEHEGLQEDGSFAYTGEGQSGDQEFTRGNLAIRDSGVSGRPIRLFSVEGTIVTYVGEFATGDPTYYTRTIGGSDGLPRQGIIFNLVPVIAEPSLLSRNQPNAPAAVAQISVWTPPDYSDIVTMEAEVHPPGERVVTRLEHALQSDFGIWLRTRGEVPSQLRLTSGGATIQPDHYVESSGWVVEAKRSSAREYVRTAIGQVLDYSHVAEKAGKLAVPVVLLPGRPELDLLELLSRHGITLIVRDGDGFEVISPSTS